MWQYLSSVHSVEGGAEPAPEVMERIYKNVDALNAVAFNRASPFSKSGPRKLSIDLKIP